ncbi:sulfite exporter TauE/SafE family protein [Qipengyuania sediminis]|uniref:sulfite exporter TauE/SafE family protein n=1 Tax=Qipengyuania sediminis TaxID=1532023 RepID=UPI0023EA5FA1|nr:sulfite exporter TauE/SafE family protein [Qipengyuania sediminis]
MLATLAGAVGGAMNALAGGGTFVTLPTLIGLGLPANIANATSNVALLPGAAASAWSFRNELRPVAGIAAGLLAVITFFCGLLGSLLLVVTPTQTFDVIVPWLLLFAFLVMLFARPATRWLHARVVIGRGSLLTVQGLLGVYGGYFGGGVGLITTALYGLLAQMHPRELFAIRTAMLATANLAAAFVFAAYGMVWWWSCVPMLLGAIGGGWLGASLGKRLSPRTVRIWTLLVTGATTVAFFYRAYGP